MNEIITGILPLVCFVSIILYDRSLHRILLLAEEDIDPTRPGLVWLNLIPIFGFFWNFYTVTQVTRAIRSIEIKICPERTSDIYSLYHRIN